MGPSQIHSHYVSDLLDVISLLILLIFSVIFRRACSLPIKSFVGKPILHYIESCKGDGDRNQRHNDSPSSVVMRSVLCLEELATNDARAVC
jgi:hypothetical protein